MAILSILRYPDARLHKVAAPVTVFDAALKTLVRDMAETMYAAPGIGLSATQVDVHRQVIVGDRQGCRRVGTERRVAGCASRPITGSAHPRFSPTTSST